MGEGRETCKKMGITDRNKVDEPAACNTLSAARYHFAFMVRIQCTPGPFFVQPDIILTRSNFCRYAGSTGAQRNRPGGRLLSTALTRPSARVEVAFETRRIDFIFNETILCVRMCVRARKAVSVRVLYTTREREGGAGLQETRKGRLAW